MTEMTSSVHCGAVSHLFYYPVRFESALVIALSQQS